MGSASVKKTTSRFALGQRIRKKLSSLLQPYLAAGLLASCADDALQDGNADADTAEQPYICSLPSSIDDALTSGTPLAENTLLPGNLVLSAGTRIAGSDQALLYTYAPTNEASCLPDTIPLEYTTLPSSEDCGCWPSLLGCEETSAAGYAPGTWRWIADDEGFPAPEECNGVDDNCNLRIDDGFSPNRPIDCPEDTYLVFDNDPEGGFKPSACHLGIQYCRNGELTACEGYIAPLEQEICDVLDNDCDGLVDEEEFPGSWGSCGYSEEEVGICRQGTYACEDGDLRCEGDVQPQAEDCNGLDDNCNGEVDEGVRGTSCYSGPLETLNVGECRAGISLCQDGSWVCQDSAPQPEECDGLDNDCDTRIDEGLVGCLACEPGSIQECRNPEILDPAAGGLVRSECGYGFQQCQSDGTWGSCRGGPDMENPEWVFTLTENCNGYDDDCQNGVDQDVDGNPLRRTCYEGSEGTADVGICRSGEQICTDGLWPTTCTDQVLPRRFDLCDDGLDNDCDGTADNFRPVYERMDIVLAIDRSGSMDDEALIETVETAIAEFLPTLEGDDHRVAVITFGHQYEHRLYGHGYPALVRQFTTLDNVLTYLRSAGADTAGSVEPNIDVIYLVTNPEGRFGRGMVDGVIPEPEPLHWRADATPYLMLFFNEGGPQSNASWPAFPYDTTSAGVDACMAQIFPCELPGCQHATNTYWHDGDPFEMDLFVDVPTHYVWQRLAPGRVYDITRIAERGLQGIEIMESLRCQQEEE